MEFAESKVCHGVVGAEKDPGGSQLGTPVDGGDLETFVRDRHGGVGAGRNEGSIWMGKICRKAAGSQTNKKSYKKDTSGKWTGHSTIDTA